LTQPREPRQATAADRRGAGAPHTTQAGVASAVSTPHSRHLIRTTRPDAAAREQMQARLAAAGARPVAQIDYWQANGGVTYQDPDGGSGVRILGLCPAGIVMGARAWVV